MFKSIWRAFKLYLEYLRLKRFERNNTRTDYEIIQLLTTASLMSGMSVGGWGRTKESLEDTLSISEVKSALRELAAYKQRELEERIKQEKENERVI